MEGHETQALEHRLKAVQLSAAALGPSHRNTLQYRTNLSVSYERLCQYEQARENALASLHGFEDTLGPEHSDLVPVLFDIALTELETGRLNDAEAKLDRAARIQAASMGAGSNWGSNVAIYRGLLRIEQGRPAEGLALANGAMDAAGVARADADALTVKGLALEGLGRHADALQVLLTAVAAYGKQQNDSTPDLIDPLRGAGLAALGLGQADKAVSLLERALKIIGRHCGTPRQRALVHFALARALVASHGDHARALELAHQARTELAALPWKNAEARQLDAWLAGPTAR
jgi:tetratricopeptide (TPR) repeat protein